MSTWPDPSATVPTTDLDNDTDNLAAARVDILDAVQKLNQILGTCTIASTPWTDLNDTTLQKRITSGTTNGIVLEDASGDVITSGKTISATLTDTDAVVPTSGAVVDYVAANTAAPLTHTGSNFTGRTATLGEATNIPTTATQVVVSFHVLSASGSGDIFVGLGDSSYSYGDSWVDRVELSAAEDLNTGYIKLTRASSSEFHKYSGTLTYTRINGTNVWSVVGQVFDTWFSSQVSARIQGYITTTSTTDRIKIIVDGSNTFDGGTASVYWVE